MSREQSKPAIRAYTVRLSLSMTLYVVVLFAVVFLFKWRPPQGPLRYGLAVLPALPIAGAIYAMGRYLKEETDEYVRYRAVRAMLWGLGVTLVLATAWGFVESFAGGPQIPMYYVFVVFCAAFGVARCLP